MMERIELLIINCYNLLIELLKFENLDLAILKVFEPYEENSPHTSLNSVSGMLAEVGPLPPHYMISRFLT